MKKVFEIIKHGMEPERAELQAQEIHEHYMKWGKDVYQNGWFVKKGKDSEELPFEEQYDNWLNLPENNI